MVLEAVPLTVLVESGYLVVLLDARKSSITTRFDGYHGAVEVEPSLSEWATAVRRPCRIYAALASSDDHLER